MHRGDSTAGVENPPRRVSPSLNARSLMAGILAPQESPGCADELIISPAWEARNPWSSSLPIAPGSPRHKEEKDNADVGSDISLIGSAFGSDRVFRCRRCCHMDCHLVVLCIFYSVRSLGLPTAQAPGDVGTKRAQYTPR